LELADEANDWVSENTDFLYLFRNPRETAFLGSDLVSMLAKGYRNSHWTEDVIREERFQYRSAVVWPIRKRRSTTDADAIHAKQDIFGYLCVDSMARAPFRERYDKPLGAAFADMLYPLLISLYRQQEKEQEMAATITDNGKAEITAD
jgi:hypothetical protein